MKSKYPIKSENTKYKLGLSEIKTYYKAVVIKTERNWSTGKKTLQRNRIMNQKNKKKKQKKLDIGT